MFGDPRDCRDNVAAAGWLDCSHARRRFRHTSQLAFLLAVAGAEPAFAQTVGPDDLLRPGEAYVTRFSGTATQADGGGQQAPAVIDTAGTVGSIIDIRAPRRPPRGEHWYDEPQRRPVTSGEVGQVFGVVLDDATPPNVYLSATSAFGLHLAAGTQQWMAGMWGPGGPGAIYRLSRDNNYQPTLFAQVTWGGRPNSGPALGNMAFDRFNKQLFVSDLETGMIHRIRAADGADRGFYDHGVIGRANFFDAENNTPGSLPPIMFDPKSSARIADCTAGPFERSPQCWNFAASGRRVWGVGVHRDVIKNETRLYYAVWSGPAFGASAQWSAAANDDKRNSVWSIRLGPDGNFDITGIRREFLLPDFFVQPSDIARAGFSQPVSDISFSECSDRPVMLLAERGGPAIWGSPPTILSPIRTTRARCATNSIPPGYGVRWDVTMSASTIARTKASRSCAQTAPAASRSRRATRPTGRWTSPRPISSSG